MKKICIAVFVLVASFAIFSVTAFAVTQIETDAVEYYDENGNLITIDGLYYNAQGFPCFNAGCYYLDGEGNPVYVGGCRAYCYDINGEFVACRCYYDAEGCAIDPPTAYRGGCGYGIWRYGDNGAIVNGSFYYDSFGNPITPPKQPGNGCCGGGRGGGRGGRWR